MDFLQRYELFKQGIALDLQNELKRVAPVDEGRLKASIICDVRGSNIVVAMVDYALYVEFGTQPHIIRPVNKKALHWKSGKADVFATEVHHPGTEPQPFIRNTFYHKLKPIVTINAERYIPEVAEEIEVSIG
jgi:hypothetical protein